MSESPFIKAMALEIMEGTIHKMRMISISYGLDFDEETIRKEWKEKFPEFFEESNNE